MEDDRFREPGVHQLRHLCPRDPILLASTPQRMPPLEEAFYELKEDAAPGVDRLAWTDYEADLECKLEDLHDRVQWGAYRALPSRRVYIPKPGGRQRPLAVAALEDKIVQRAVVTLLNAIYEENFLGFSYGFRPGRGTHDARSTLMWWKSAVNRSFFSLATFRMRSSACDTL